MFIAALFFDTVTKTFGATEMSVSRWMEDAVCVCMCVWYYLAIKKNEIIPFAVKWRGQEIIILSEVNQGKAILHVESKKIIQMNLFTK